MTSFCLVLLSSVIPPFASIPDPTRSTSQGHQALHSPPLAAPPSMWAAARRGGLPRPQVPALASAPVRQLPNPALVQTGREPSQSGPAQWQR